MSNVNIGESHWRLKLFLELCWEQCNNNDDVILFINGSRGKGKSTLGVQMLRHYIEKYLNIRFNKQVLREHIIYDYDALMDKGRNLPDKHPVMIDEGVRVAYSGDFAAKEVKTLVKFFAQCRTKHRLTIIISPNFTDITTRLRSYAKYRVRCEDRGIGVLFSRDNSEGVDPFHLDMLKSTERFHDDLYPVKQTISRLRKHPCFKDILTWGPLPIDLDKAYNEYRDENVYAEEVETSNSSRLQHVIQNMKDCWTQFRSQDKLSDKVIYQHLVKDCITGLPFIGEQPWINECGRFRKSIGKDRNTMKFKRGEEVKERLKAEEQAKEDVFSL